jgi:hypothetical protein
MLVDATNTTMRDRFFRKWSDCAKDPECISPNGVYTVLMSAVSYYNGSAFR